MIINKELLRMTIYEVPENSQFFYFMKKCANFGQLDRSTGKFVDTLQLNYV